MLSLLLTTLALSGTSLGQSPTFGKWCGKYYQPDAPYQTARPEGSLFEYPAVSSAQLFDFRCTTKSSIYIEGDEQYDQPMILLDTNITNDVGQTFNGDATGSVRIDVWSDDENYLVGGQVDLNMLGSLMPFNVSSLSPSKTQYNLTCKAQFNGQTFYTNSTLSYLPQNPYGGNTVKINRKTEALLVRNETSGDKTWQQLVPYGWYDGYNSSSEPKIYGPEFGTTPANDTLNRLRLAKSLGMNMVHPVPPGGSSPYTFTPEATAQFEQYMDLTESLGLYVQYDMRNTYLNLSSVQDQVEMLRNRSNILAWYTGDEPDGADDPLNATRLAYDLIYELDGYHPVSLVLNCENYYFQEYGLDGADILMVDPYPFAINARWSKPWNTYVDENFGDSGCDNCNGTAADISANFSHHWLMNFAHHVPRLTDREHSKSGTADGNWRNKPAWVVPQAFNDRQASFWYRAPLGHEGQAVNPVISWNHGGQGAVAWEFNDATKGLLGNASHTSRLLHNQSRFLVDAYESRVEIFSNLTRSVEQGIDLAKWSVSESNGTETLVLAVNWSYNTLTFNLDDDYGSIKQVLEGNVTAGDNGAPLFVMPRTSIAAVILQQ